MTSQVRSGQTFTKQVLYLRHASIVALLIAPLLAIPPLARVLVDRFAPPLAHLVTTNLERAFAWRTIASPPDVDAVVPDATPHSTIAERDDNPAVMPRSPQPATKRHRGIVVRMDAVVRAVRSGGRPSSFPAPASNNRPAGLSLVGVSRFGTGLRDGDILTSVGGTPATSEGTVVGIVAGAIAAGAKVITGVVWRDDQRLDVAVEIPGPDAFTKKRRRKSVRQ